MSKSKNVNNRQFGQSAVTGVVLPDGTSDTETAGGGGGSRPVSGTEPNTPKLLTGGHPRTEVSKIPTLPLAEVPVFEHGGYDGGIEVGFDGTWMVEKFPGLIEKLEEAKNRACEIQKEPEGFKIVLAGEEVLVMATGAKVGGLLYKYRFICRGVEFLVHSNPPKNRQPVRVRYLSESLIGNNFFTVHEQFVMPFLKRLGLTVHADKPSRIDMQVMIDVPVSEFIELFKTGHGVTKLRRGASFFAVTPSGFVDDTLTLGCIKRVQVSIYDKRKEMQKMDLVKQAFFIQCCVGDEWFNSGRPITRVEVRLGRVALKCLGVNTITDLKEREHAMLDLITKDWFRILKDPKVRGHETSAAIHPVWERVRILFGSYFSGASVEDVKWEKDQSVSCDPVALEKQALGCLSKALAARYGEQSSRRSSVVLATEWVGQVQNELHEKVNCFAEHVRIKTGITLGDVSYPSMGYEEDDKAERDYMQGIGKRKGAEMYPIPVQQFYDPPGDTVGERFNDFMDKTKDIHLRR